MLDDLRTIIGLRETGIHTIEPVRAILDGADTLEWVPATTPAAFFEIGAAQRTTGSSIPGAIALA